MKELPIFNNPAKGEPCNGCGMCCYLEACGIAQAVFGDDRTPCGALEFVDGKFLCGMVRHPSKYIPELKSAEQEQAASNLFSAMLGIGKGCCAEEIKDFA